MEVSSAGVISADANSLSLVSSTVSGIAADGAAATVLRIAAPAAGTAFTLTLLDENGVAAGSGSDGALGYMTTLLPSDPPTSTAAGTPITVTSVALASGGSMAFAVYHAPKDFVRDGNALDSELPVRTVSVQLSGGGASLQQPIQIVRPPVTFIHGIWGSGDDGDQILSSLMSAGMGLTTYALGYDGAVPIISSTPSYESNLSVSGSNLGFSFAASIVLPELHDAIADYRTNSALGQPIAVVRADVVAHSMGGDVARMLPLMNGFAGLENYELGPLHKLITIGTPHLGSPLAQQLLNGSNDCVKRILADGHRYAFTSVATRSGSYNGGVGDLSADVFGTSLSGALTAIQQGSVMIPTALIAANMSPAQLSVVDTAPAAIFIRSVCGNPVINNPLAVALTSSGWPAVLSSQSDAIVPVNSQLDGSAQNTVFPLAAEVHSPGTEKLGFGGPSELDDTSVIVPEVLQLLNTPVDQSAFKPLP